jgi:hypothetical protein
MTSGWGLCGAAVSWEQFWQSPQQGEQQPKNRPNQQQ